ncbi:MAG TPA: alpha-amylase family glycosyl hydrolase, partial [Acidimicrobiales bacterium]|nr:alpha-amylase family glycosyl hydrolase [Acidimicrobiales bacterium]
MAAPWWQSGVVYQIYPRSFLDTDGDGVGDLEGVRRRLDHLAWLGVDAVWLSPIFRSPMADFGYDVSDYCDVDPVFGDLDDLDRLVADAHDRDIRLILDWVPNHTSDQHPW